MISQPVAIRSSAPTPRPEAVLTKAVVAVAAQLQLKNRELAAMLGMSEANASRLRSGRYELVRSKQKEWEFAVELVKLHRALLRLFASPDTNLHAWLTSDNLDLKGKPLEIMQTARGMISVTDYLEAYSYLT
jgi:hypothetical protein